MKLEFWGFSFQLFGIIFSLIISFIFTLTFGILAIFNNSMWIGSIFGLILFIVCLLIFFGDKKYLTKIKLSEEGIICKWRNKQIASIKWENIIEVSETPRSFVLSWLTLTTKTQKINIELTKNIYNTIIEICPNPNLKVMINELNGFKGFHKNQK